MDNKEAMDRIAILDLLPRYNRGVDRADLVVLNGVWAEGAVVGDWDCVRGRCSGCAFRPVR